jgi:hypothetical protein
LPNALRVAGDDPSAERNPVFQPGEPQVLFKTPKNARLLASAPDRSRFLISIPIDGAGPAPEPFTVVLNWQTALNK